MITITLILKKYMETTKPNNPTKSLGKQKIIINIGRQLGSGGRLIGRQLAKSFGIEYYDKEILALAAKESGFCEEVFQRNDEKKGFFNSLFDSVVPMMAGVEGIFYSNQVSDENLFRLQSEAIRKAAADHSCIFIGRCADYVLRDYPYCVNVFIAADEKDRIRRIMDLANVSEKEAEKLMLQGDRSRAEFYNFYSAGEWGAASTYHLCINSSVLGINGTAEFIKKYVEKRLGIEE